MKRFLVFLIAFPVITVAYVVFTAVVAVVMVLGLVAAPLKVWQSIDNWFTDREKFGRMGFSDENKR